MLGCLAAVVLTRTEGAQAVLIGSTLVGAGFGPVYALSLAVLSERIEASELAAGSAAFTSSFAIGCVLGPILTAATMHVFGAVAVFLPTIAIFASVVVRCSWSRIKPLPLALLSGSEKGR
jgi:MFS family permease